MYSESQFQPKGKKMSLISVVEDVVEEKVRAGELFTAHDITLEVRSRGHRASHGQVRDAVHDYYNRGGLGLAYVRTNITVPGGNPYLYHRGADDPSVYQNVRGNNSVSPSVQDDDDDDDDDDNDNNVPIAIPANLFANLNSSQKTSHVRNKSRVANKPGIIKNRSVDGRGSLSIPSPIIRQLGFKPHQKVYAVASFHGVDVRSTEPPHSTVYGKYTVDSHQQVRLTQSLLKRAGIAGTQYDVEQLADSVVVKLSK